MKYKITVEPDLDGLLKEVEDEVPPFAPPGLPVFGPRQEDWHLNARLNYMDVEGRWMWYADGYKAAGDLLVELAGSLHHEVDILIYPVAFNYRQYLEVRLKELMLLSARYLGHPFSVPITHDLLKLWKQLQGLLADQKIADPALTMVEHVVNQFHEADKGSYSFRYPVGRDGALVLDDLPDINLGQLRDRISEAAHLLDGLSAGIGEHLNQKREYEAEMRAEAASAVDGYSTTTPVTTEEGEPANG